MNLNGFGFEKTIFKLNNAIHGPCIGPFKFLKSSSKVYEYTTNQPCPFDWKIFLLSLCEVEAFHCGGITFQLIFEDSQVVGDVLSDDTVFVRLLLVGKNITG